jgi:hypothetical protein
MKCVVRFAFGIRVVMTSPAADRLLFFHLDAREMIHQPLDQTGLLPWKHKSRSIVASFVLVHDEADGSLDPVASISKDDNSAIAVQYCNISVAVAYVGLHDSPTIPRYW